MSSLNDDYGTQQESVENALRECSKLRDRIEELETPQAELDALMASGRVARDYYGPVTNMRHSVRGIQDGGYAICRFIESSIESRWERTPFRLLSILFDTRVAAQIALDNRAKDDDWQEVK